MAMDMYMYITFIPKKIDCKIIFVFLGTGWNQPTRKTSMLPHCARLRDKSWVSTSFSFRRMSLLPSCNSEFINTWHFSILQIIPSWNLWISLACRRSRTVPFSSTSTCLATTTTRTTCPRGELFHASGKLRVVDVAGTYTVKLCRHLAKKSSTTFLSQGREFLVS